MRSKGLLNIIKILKLVKSKPQYIFLENVVNFEISVCRQLLISTLDDLGYEIKEYLVSPLQFGIPNDRKRYYLSANLQNAIKETKYLSDFEIIKNINSKKTQLGPLSSYLEDLSDIENYMVPDNFITKRNNFRFGNKI